MFINLKQNKNLKLFKIISEVAGRNGQSVYAVGGFVRDLLMQRKAPTDIDFVTESSGIELQKASPKKSTQKQKWRFSKLMEQRCLNIKIWNWNL